MSKILLGDRVDFNYGFSVRVGEEPAGDYAVFGSNGETGFINSYKIAGPGVIIGRKGSVGAINYSEKNFTPTDTAYYLSIKDPNTDDLDFWFYYLQLLGLDKLNTHSSVPGLSREVAYLLEVTPPEISTQKLIATVLSSLDKKINNNKNINYNLDLLVKTIFDYWFIQFDFPNEENSPYKTSGGELVWNDLIGREIPLGWEVAELSSIANITMGQSPPGESYNDNGDGVIFFQGSTDFGDRFPIIRQYTNQPSRMAKRGDILLSVRAPVGELNIAGDVCCIGRGLAALNSKIHSDCYLMGVMINLKQIFDRRNGDGTTFGSITKDDLFSLKVLKPSETILKKFDQITKPIFDRQSAVDIENKTLLKTRNWLMPMLLNGQIKIN